MESKIRKYFDEIIALAQTILHDIKIEEDLSDKRALLKLNGKLESMEVKITEIIDEKRRKYSYYLIKNGIVEFGFDNAPDLNALKIKYAKNYIKHLRESIPHYHGREKKNTELTELISPEEFFKKIELFANEI